MKGRHDKIYIASNDMDYSHPDESEFRYTINRTTTVYYVQNVC